MLPEADMVEGRLGLAWDPKEGGLVTGPIRKSEMLSLKKDLLHPIVTLRREKTGRWTTNATELKPEKDKRETPEEWWLPVGCPVRELTFNPVMWQVRETPQAADGRSMLACSSAQLGRVLKKPHSTLSDLHAVWHLTEEKGEALMKTIWSGELAPSLGPFYGY